MSCPERRVITPSGPDLKLFARPKEVAGAHGANVLKAKQQDANIPTTPETRNPKPETLNPKP